MNDIGKINITIDQANKIEKDIKSYFIGYDLDVEYGSYSRRILVKCSKYNSISLYIAYSNLVEFNHDIFICSFESDYLSIIKRYIKTNYPIFYTIITRTHNLNQLLNGNN
jgi:hypothetical protein